jgi:hypothetical protein
MLNHSSKILREKTLGIRKHTEEDNIKMDFKEIECEDMDWIQMAADRIQW